MPSSTGLASTDQLARRVHLVPRVPEQEPARAPFPIRVRDDALPVRLDPVLDRRQPGVDLPHRLVAEIEHVGVEERQVVVRHFRAGHVGADDLAVRVGVILVLDAGHAGELRHREVGDVAGGEDVVAIADAAVHVHDDAVVHRETGGLGQLRVRDDPQPRHHDVALECPRAGLDRRAASHRAHPPAGQHLDAVLAVVVRDERRQLRRKDAGADARLRHDHRHGGADTDERCRQLRADEPAADDDDARALDRFRAQPMVVVERAEVDDAVGVAQLARLPARREQELLPGVVVALVVRRGVPLEVDRDDAPSEPELDAGVGGAAPDLRLVSPAPESLRQRRALVRRVLLGADERDRLRPRRARGCPSRRRRPSCRRRRSDSASSACHLVSPVSGHVSCP